MFTFLLHGRIGDFLAPRQAEGASEISLLIKAGLAENALKIIRNSNSGINLNELDLKSGMAPLHFAAASGALVTFLHLNS